MNPNPFYVLMEKFCEAYASVYAYFGIDVYTPEGMMAVAVVIGINIGILRAIERIEARNSFN